MRSKVKRINGREIQWFYVLDFGMARDSSETRLNVPSPKYYECKALFHELVDYIGGTLTLRCLEQFHDLENDDPDWKEFLLDMDPREKMTEWIPFCENTWETFGDIDECMLKEWKNERK